MPRLEDNSEITFKEEEMEYLDLNYDDALVISMRMINAQVKRVMIDIGSSANTLYLYTFQKLGLSANGLTPMTFFIDGVHW